MPAIRTLHRWCARTIVVAVLVTGIGVVTGRGARAAVAAPGPVRSLRVTSVQATSVSLAWLAPLGSSVAITAYRVDRRSAGSDWVQVSDAIPVGTTGSLVSYTATGLTKGTKYQFRVRGIAGTSLGTPIVAGTSQLSAGWTSVCAVRVSGSVQCAGQNGSGQLGNGTTTESSTPVDVVGISNAFQVSVGQAHACAVVGSSASSVSGSVKCWGSNSSGQLGNGTRVSSSVPVAAGSRTDYVAVAAGGEHTCALTSSGAVYCWGDGSLGQLGRSSTTSSLSPVVASSVSGVAAIGAGTMFTCAVIAATGGVACWGENDSGQFGNGSSSSAITTAVTAIGVANAVSVSGGLAHMCVMTNSGDIRCFGETDVGQTGSGTFANAVGMDTGTSRTCAVTDAGARMCWGDIAETGQQSAVPSKVSDDIALTDEGHLFGCAVSITGSVTCTGTLPVASMDVSAWDAESITPSSVPDVPTSVRITASSSSTLRVEWSAPTDDGGVAVSDYRIQLSTDSGTTFTEYADGVSTSTSVVLSGLQRNTVYTVKVSAINARGTGSGALVSGRTNRTIGSITVPGLVRMVSGSATSTALTLTWVAPLFDGGSDVTDYVIQYSSDNSSWTTIDDGVSTSTSSIVSNIPGGMALAYRVAAVNSMGTGPATAWGATAIVAGGFHTCMRTSTARIQCWGDNSVGQLGAGSSTLTSSTPLQVSTITTAVAVAAGIAHTCATTATGSVYCWGENASGQVGDGTTVVRRRPVLVSGVTVAPSTNSLWERDVIATGSNHTCAVTSTGRVKCWGDDLFGQVTRRTPSVSDPDLVYVPTPTTVVGSDGKDLTGVIGVAAGDAHSCALFASGRVSCWGDNSYAQATPPDSLANVVRIAAAGDHTCVLRDDGGVECWGGDNVAAAAAQLASLSDVVGLSVSLGGECVTSSDGAVRCFGTNDAGQTGAGLTLPSAVAVAAGSSHACALTTSGLVQCWGDNEYAELGVSIVPESKISTVTGIAPRVVTLATAPMSPSALRVSAVRGTQVDIAWTAPSDGGSAITDYVIETIERGDPFADWTVYDDSTSTSTSTTLTLTQGVDYSVRVRAKNAVGTGAPSSSVDVRAYTVPSAPLSFGWSASDGTIAFTWDVPTSDGGSPVTRYEVTLGSGESCGTTTLTCSITGLTNGTVYPASVTAQNAAGSGASATAIVIPRTTPGVVGAITATGGDSRVTLTWTSPSNDGGSAVTAYQVSRDGGAWTFVSTTTTNGKVTTVANDLSNGLTYSFRVRAVNLVGAGIISLTASATPMVVDSAPVLTSAVADNGQVALSWIAGRWGGGEFVQFQVADADGSLVCTTTAASCTISGLSNGVAATFTVRTVTSAGTSDGASVTVTPRTVPSIVRNLGGTGADGSVSLSWDAPASDGGVPVLRYEVSRDGGTWSSVGLVVSTTVTGLSNGTTYSFRVRAVNAAGVGAASSAATATPAAVVVELAIGIPGAPTITSLTRGNTQATLEWAVSDDGGAAIVEYQYSIDGGVWVSTGSTSHATVDQLTNGQVYSVRVRARNSVGWSQASAAQSVTPATTPDAVIVQSVIPGDRQVTVTWLAPQDDGGSTVTAYDVAVDVGTSPSWVRVTATTTSVSVEGLTNGSTYNVLVRAVNDLGVGTVGDASIATPRTSPSAAAVSIDSIDDGAVSVSWTEPNNDGGAPVLGYEYTTDGGTSWFFAGGSIASSLTIANLTNGSSYDIRIRARNAAGHGAMSPSIIASPYTVPSSPAEVALTSGDESITVQWSTPDDGGRSIVRYELSTDGGATWATIDDEDISIDGDQRTSTLNDLVNGTAYAVQVRAVNIAGEGPASSPRVGTPVGAPDAPEVAAQPGNSSVMLTWTGPTRDGGTPVIDFQVQRATWNEQESFVWSNVTSSAVGTSLNVASLSSDTTYVFRVRARNNVGFGTWSDIASATPFGVAGQPTSPIVERGGRQLIVSWSAPVSSGGLPVLRYEYRVCNSVASACGTWSTATSPSIVPGLDDGTTYTVQVRAVTAVGAGTSVATVGTTLARPNAPTDLGLNLDTESLVVTVSWSASAVVPGEADVRNYEVTATPVSSGTTASVCSTRASTRGGVVPTTCDLAGLTLGTTYQIAVVANNGVGDSSSLVDTIAVRRRPGAPTSLVGTALDGSARLVWVAPTDDGGATISRYEYTITDGESWVEAGSAASITVAGLTNGTTYEFQVRAISDAGASDASNTVSVRPLPPVPTFAASARVAGALVVGASLTCDVGTLSTGVSYSYSWKRGASTISGARSRAYTATSADIGQVLGCGVTASNLAGSVARRATAAGAVLKVGTRASRRPAVTPTAGVRPGTTISCSRGTWSASPTEFVFRFILNGSLTLAQGPSSTYKVTSASSGGRVSCEVYAWSKSAKYGGVSLSNAVAVR